MQHDGRDYDFSGSSLGDFIRDQGDPFPDRDNHVPSRTEPDNGVLLVAGHAGTWAETRTPAVTAIRSSSAARSPALSLRNWPAAWP